MLTSKKTCITVAKDKEIAKISICRAVFSETNFKGRLVASMHCWICSHSSWLMDKPKLSSFIKEFYFAIT